MLESIGNFINGAKAVFGFLWNAMLFSRWFAGKALFFLMNVINFPPFGQWYLWMPLWFLWWNLITKPETFANILAKIEATASSIGGKAKAVTDAIYGIKVLGPLVLLVLWIFAFPLMVMIYVIHKGIVVKFILVAAAINLILKWIPWWASYPLVIIALAVWAYWLRSPAEQAKTTKIYRDLGPWKGTFVLVFEGFLPKGPKTKWRCEFCGKWNPIDEQGNSPNFCNTPHCRARNPEADWKCVTEKPEGGACGTVNKGARQFCWECGGQNPFRDQHGHPLPIRPAGLPPHPAHPALPPHEDESVIDMVVCPRCNNAAPRADFCGECGFRFTSQNGNAQTSLTDGLDDIAFN